MNKKEWQLKHSLDDKYMEELTFLKKIVNGKITLVAMADEMPTRQRKKITKIITGLIKGVPGKIVKSRSYYKGQWNRTTHT